MKHKIRLIYTPLLLAVFLFLTITASKRTSPLCDEVAHHVAAGYSYVKTLDFRMNPAQPALIREFIGFPLLFLDLRLPTDHISWLTNDSPVFGRLFVYEYNKDKTEDIIFWSRFLPIILSTILGFFIFLWAKKIYGVNAGIFALFLYVFSPAVLGNSGVAMTDMGGSLFIFLAIFQYWRFLKCKDKVLFNLFLSGVCFGLAQSAKITAIILYPLLFILAFSKIMSSSSKIAEFKKQIKFLLVIFGVGIFVLWMSYAFEFKPLLKNAPDIEEKINYIKQFCAIIPFLNHPRIVDNFILFAKEIPIPLSTYIVTLLGVVHQLCVPVQGLYFMGRKLSEGPRIYYAVNYIIKTPLPVIILIILNSVCSIFKKRSKIDLQTSIFVLLPIFLLFIIASFSHLQGGVRYLLPAYPFLFIWLSDVIDVRFHKRIYLFASRIILVLLMLWYVTITIRIHPHHLSYFNDLVGGPGGFGYKITADADWGQGLPALASYLKKKDIDSVKLLYWGTADPAYYGIKYKELDGEDRKFPRKDVYAISLRSLGAVKWTQDCEPTDRPGYSIFVYDFRSKKPHNNTD